MFKSTSVRLQGPSILIVTPLFDAGLWLLLGRWRVGITQVSRSREKGGVTWSPGCWAARRNKHEEGVRAKEGEGGLPIRSEQPRYPQGLKFQDL